MNLDEAFVRPNANCAAAKLELIQIEVWWEPKLRPPSLKRLSLSIQRSTSSLLIVVSPGDDGTAQKRIATANRPEPPSVGKHFSSSSIRSERSRDA